MTAIEPRMVPLMVCGRRNFQKACWKATRRCMGEITTPAGCPAPAPPISKWQTLLRRLCRPSAGVSWLGRPLCSGMPASVDLDALLVVHLTNMLWYQGLQAQGKVGWHLKLPRVKLDCWLT